MKYQIVTGASNTTEIECMKRRHMPTFKPDGLCGMVVRSKESFGLAQAQDVREKLIQAGADGSKLRLVYAIKP